MSYYSQTENDPSSPEYMTENGALINFFENLIPVETIHAGDVVVLSDRDGNQTVEDTLDLELRRREEQKKEHAAGTFIVHTPDSFVSYIARHGTTNTEVWFDMQNQALFAQIDGHSDDNKAGLERHKVRMSLLRTKAWNDWRSIDRNALTQEQLSEFIQNHYLDFQKPTMLDALQIAENFQATRNVRIESVARSKSGTKSIIWKEEDKASGQWEIPDKVAIRLVMFESGAPTDIELRWNYRIDPKEKTLKHLWMIEYRDELEQLAFKATCESIKDKLEQLSVAPTVFYGSGR